MTKARRRAVLEPTGITVTPDGGTVYVANMDSDTISVIRR